MALTTRDVLLWTVFVAIAVLHGADKESYTTKPRPMKRRHDYESVVTQRRWRRGGGGA